MDDFFERLKDILYDSVDYIIMLAIIIVVVAVIGWRLDILFAKDNLDAEHGNDITAETPRDNSTKKPTEKPEVDKTQGEKQDSNGDIPSDNGEKDNEDLDHDSNDTVEKNPDEHLALITIDIPEGSLPSKIGSILETSGLIDNKNDFVLKAQEMDLDRNLRSGKYEIKKDSTIEEIVKIIARQK